MQDHETERATERVNVAEHLTDKPAIWSIPPQDDTARFYAKSLMDLVRSKKKLDKEEAAWQNLYNKYRRRSNREEEEDTESEELSKKDLHYFVISKTNELQKYYENEIAKLRTQHETEISKLRADHDKRIDDILAKTEKQREDNLTKILGIVATVNKDATQAIEKAHNGANQHIVTTLNSSNTLATSATNAISTQWNQATEASKKHYKKIEELLENQEDPGFWATFIEEVLLPHKEDLKKVTKENIPKLLQVFKRGVEK